jgi:predicted nucleic acid-binding protein
MRHYVDSSVVYSLASKAAHATGNPAPQIELTRAQKAATFIQKVRKAGGEVLTSPLALEELAARVRNSLRAIEAKKKGYASWRDFKNRASKADIAQADTRPHTIMIHMLSLATREFSKVGIELERTAVLSSETKKAAQELQKTHLKYLSQHTTLDAMDAFHIALAAELGITHFLSFDQGWGQLPNITVYY